MLSRLENSPAETRLLQQQQQKICKYNKQEVKTVRRNDGTGPIILRNIEDGT